MDFIFTVASKMMSFPAIYYFIASLSFFALELLSNKLFKGGF